MRVVFYRVLAILFAVPLVSADCGSRFEEAYFSSDVREVELSEGEVARYELRITASFPSRRVNVLGLMITATVEPVTATDAYNTEATLTCEVVDGETGAVLTESEMVGPPRPQPTVLFYGPRTPFEATCTLEIRPTGRDPQHVVRASWQASVEAEWDGSHGQLQVEIGVNPS